MTATSLVTGTCAPHIDGRKRVFQRRGGDGRAAHVLPEQRIPCRWRALSATNNATDFAAAYRPVLVMYGGGFIGGTASGNGGAHIYGAYDIFYFNTEAAYNWKDGLNAHVLSPTTGGGFPRVVEIGTKCLWRNGWDGLNLLPVTTNATITAHCTRPAWLFASCQPTAATCRRRRSEGRPLHDIDSARRLVFGGTLGVSASMQTVATGANYPSVQAGNSDSHATVMDLYECNVPVGGNTALYSYAGSAIRCHGMEGIFAGLTKGGATANITNVALSLISPPAGDALKTPTRCHLYH